MQNHIFNYIRMAHAIEKNSLKYINYFQSLAYISHSIREQNDEMNETPPSF